MAEGNPDTRKIYYILLGSAVILLGVVFKNLSSVMLPVIFSVLLGFVLLPVVQNLNRKFHIPWALGAITMTILAVLLVGILSSLLIASLSQIISQFPKYERRFMTIYRLAAENFGLEIDEEKSFLSNIWRLNQFRDTIKNFAIAVSGGLVTIGKTLFTVFLLLAFFLIELKNTQTKIEDVFAGKTDERKRFTIISTKIVSEVIHYLSIKFSLSFLTGILVWLGTSLIQMDFPVVWGFLAFIMNFIPTFGSIISCVLTILFAILQFYPGIWEIIVVIFLMISVNFVLGNIIEPKIEGEDLGLSPFVILVSLSLWGYIWGFVGMILAVPMMVIIKITCENVDYLKGFAIFIGNGKKQKREKNLFKNIKTTEKNPSSAE